MHTCGHLCAHSSVCTFVQRVGRLNAGRTRTHKHKHTHASWHRACVHASVCGGARSERERTKRAGDDFVTKRVVESDRVHHVAMPLEGQKFLTTLGIPHLLAGDRATTYHVRRRRGEGWGGTGRGQTRTEGCSDGSDQTLQVLS